MKAKEYATRELSVLIDKNEPIDGNLSFTEAEVIRMLKFFAELKCNEQRDLCAKQLPLDNPLVLYVINAPTPDL